jgi:hypothetical protein
MNVVGGPHDPQDGPKSGVGKPGCTRWLAHGPPAVRRRSAERPCRLDQCRQRPTSSVQVSALSRSIRAGQSQCRHRVGDDVSIHQTATPVGSGGWRPPGEAVQRLATPQPSFWTELR